MSSSCWPRWPAPMVVCCRASSSWMPCAARSTIVRPLDRRSRVQAAVQTREEPRAPRDFNTVRGSATPCTCRAAHELQSGLPALLAVLRGRAATSLVFAVAIAAIFEIWVSDGAHAAVLRPRASRSRRALPAGRRPESHARPRQSALRDLEDVSWPRRDGGSAAALPTSVTAVRAGRCRPRRPPTRCAGSTPASGASSPPCRVFSRRSARPRSPCRCCRTSAVVWRWPRPLAPAAVAAARAPDRRRPRLVASPRGPGPGAPGSPVARGRGHAPSTNRLAHARFQRDGRRVSLVAARRSAPNVSHGCSPAARLRMRWRQLLPLGRHRARLAAPTRPAALNR